MQTSKAVVTLIFAILATGCAVTQAPPAPALSNTARDQIGRLAIRGPSRPTVTLTNELMGKGEAAGKTAVSAGAGWLSGTFDAASASNGEGAGLVLVLGVLATPMVAAGGAMYGAAAADSKEAVLEGNAVLEQALDFAPSQLQHALAEQFELSAPVGHEFVSAKESNAELLRLGFDSVLDVEMDSISSHPSENDFHVYFETFNRIRLTDLSSGKELASRSYRRGLAPRAVSGWAANDGGNLAAALDGSFNEIAVELVEELFLAPAIRVRGMEPVSRGPWGVGQISGTRPMFVWSALDGGQAEPQGDVDYEIEIGVQGRKEPQRHRVSGLRYVPAEPLEGCRTYQWQVRAHYRSFGNPATTEWTPRYRFKTPCER